MPTATKQLTLIDTTPQLLEVLPTTAPLFCLDISRVKDVLLKGRAHHHVQRLDTADNVTKFQAELTNELGDLLDDAIEMAFLRAFPEIINNLGRYPDGESSDLEDDADEEDEEDSGHSFESKDCCDACDTWWWNNHDLNDCLSEGEVSNCIQHENHPGKDCYWSDNCPKHDEHALTDCLDACSTVHDHEEWHEAIDQEVLDVRHRRHDYDYPECDYFTDPDAELEDESEQLQEELIKAA